MDPSTVFLSACARFRISNPVVRMYKTINALRTVVIGSAIGINFTVQLLVRRTEMGIQPCIVLLVQSLFYTTIVSHLMIKLNRKRQVYIIL